MEQPRSGVYDPRSTGEFQAWFRTDADYLEWLRWPGGFTCPDGGHAGGWRLGDGRLECTACHGRTSYGTPQPPRREGKTGWRDTGSQAGRPRVQAGACLGDISPFWVSEGGLEHGNRCDLPGSGKSCNKSNTSQVDSAVYPSACSMRFRRERSGSAFGKAARQSGRT